MSGRKRKTRRARRKSVRHYGGFEGGRKRRSRRSRRSRARLYGFSMKSINPVGIATQIAGVGAGAVAGSFAAKYVPIANPKIKALIPILLGIVLPMLPKVGRMKIMADIATGSIAIGTISLVRQFLPSVPLLAGAESAESVVAAMNQLPDEQKAILGIQDETLTGAEEVLTGAEENLSPANVG